MRTISVGKLDHVFLKFRMAGFLLESNLGIEHSPWSWHNKMRRVPRAFQRRGAEASDPTTITSSKEPLAISDLYEHSALPTSLAESSSFSNTNHIAGCNSMPIMLAINTPQMQGEVQEGQLIMKNMIHCLELMLLPAALVSKLLLSPTLTSAQLCPPCCLKVLVLTILRACMVLLQTTIVTSPGAPCPLTTPPPSPCPWTLCLHLQALYTHKFR